MLQNRRNRVLIAIIAVLLVLLGMLATTAFSRKVLDPDVFALGSDEMPGIGDYVSLGDLEVRVDEVDKRDAAGVKEATADYRTVLGGKAVENVDDLFERRGDDGAGGGGSGGSGSNDSNSGGSSGSGSDLTVIKVDIRNNGDSPVDFHEITPPSVNVQTADGTRAAPLTEILADVDAENQVLQPGDSIPGAVVVDVPAGSEPGWVRWSDPSTGQSATTDIGGGDEVPGTCENSDVDLMETELGNFLAVNTLPLAEGGQYPELITDLQVDSNQFDPCAELSWALLSGSSDSEARESGDTDLSHIVVFFTGDHVAPFDSPVYRDSVSVHRDDDGSVTVTDKAGNEDTYDADGLVDPSTDGADEHVDFEFAKVIGALGGTAFNSPLPYGNVHSATPLRQADLGRYERYFRAQTHGLSVFCSLAAEPGVTCRRESGTWTLPDGTETDSITADLTKTGYERGSYGLDLEGREPGSAAGEPDGFSSDAFDIPSDSMALLRRTLLVDTRGGIVRIFVARMGVQYMLQLDSERAQVATIENQTNPYNLDLSRWPHHKSREATETPEP